MVKYYGVCHACNTLFFVLFLFVCFVGGYPFRVGKKGHPTDAFLRAPFSAWFNETIKGQKHHIGSANALTQGLPICLAVSPRLYFPCVSGSVLSLQKPVVKLDHLCTRHDDVHQRKLGAKLGAKPSAKNLEGSLSVPGAGS